MPARGVFFLGLVARDPLLDGGFVPLDCARAGCWGLQPSAWRSRPI